MVVVRGCACSLEVEHTECDAWEALSQGAKHGKEFENKPRPATLVLKFSISKSSAAAESWASSP